MDKAAIYRKVFLLFSAALAIVTIVLFLPAGTLDYWQAWVYMAVIYGPAALVIAYFLRYNPAFLERRFQTREKEAKQQLVQKLGAVIFVLSFLIPGLDRRFGWSSVPVEQVVAADAIVLLGYLFVFWVFRENEYASRTIQVVSGQKVVSTGPYAFVRHPMYLGTIALYLATPIALGSYYAFPIFLLMAPILIYRILNEEDVLRRELKGYTAYCRKVRYRLVPLVW